MKIASILNHKGRHFETVAHTTQLLDAVRIMHREAIGSIGVYERDPGNIVGIVSQTELMEAISVHGSSSFNLTVSSFMRRSLINCICEDNVANVMVAMTDDRFRHAIVRNSAGRVAGIVSMGDLVAAQLEEARLETGVLRDMARSHILAGSA